MDSHHVVFEDIGQMASAVTYIHARIVINLTDIEQLYLLYNKHLDDTQTKLEYINNTLVYKYDNNTKKFIKSPWNDFGKYEWYIKQSIDIVDQHRMTAYFLLEEVNSLRKVLPPPVDLENNRYNRPTRETHSITDMMIEHGVDHAKDHLLNKAGKAIGKIAGRMPRFMPFATLGLGVLGTFMGLYNRQQIKVLQQDLATLGRNFNQLVDITTTNTQDINNLKLQMADLSNFMMIIHEISAPSISIKLTRMELIIKRRITKAVAAVQQAQHRRLAVNYLPTKKLKQLYHNIETTALKMKNQLITTQPSDLFQLEVSYFFDGQDLQLLLHVPTVADNSMIRLFKLHPLPLPINEGQALVPIVQQDVLGLTVGVNKYMMQLASTDLLDCHRVNKIFLCERHGVISKNLNDSCLGSLYIQNYESAEKLCHLQIQPIKEIVYQLLNNWFLIYSPIPQTSIISCFNGTESQFHLPKGISQRHLSAGCKATFISHILFTDSSIKLENEIQHYEWDWESKVIQDHDPAEFMTMVNELIKGGITQPTVSDLNHLKFHRKSGFNYTYFLVSFISSIVALALIGFIVFICITNAGYRKLFFDYMTPKFVRQRRERRRSRQEQRLEQELQIRFSDLANRSQTNTLDRQKVTDLTHRDNVHL
jgi:hypothetical protein